eukprot:TRINITY_DN3272_c0_g1_i1.p1 TRINITY_DN3272_c0_g1~~TRINITY_DN3272_c0_g1_i1.p1  ORF type:complete len:601 (+),score=105.49 TRINITY_DN3272_c0_g1_i1:77-1879(+)
MIKNLEYVIAGVQNWACKILLEMGMKNIFSLVVCMSGITMARAGRNMYDYTTTCKFTPACYDYSKVYSFMEKPEVLKRLSSEGKKWAYADDNVSNALLYDNVDDYSSGFAELLKKKIPLVLYYGDKDFTCNYEGGWQWIKELNWEHKNSLLSQKEVKLKFNELNVGISQSFYLVDFVRISGSGHFVTLDRPEVGSWIMESLTGKGIYKFLFCNGLMTLLLGYPAQEIRVAVGTEIKSSWIASESCTLCKNYERYRDLQTNSTNYMNEQIEERVQAGTFKGELVYDIVENARVSFVLAKEIPTIPIALSNRVAGVVSFSFPSFTTGKESNFASTLFNQGKVEDQIVALYGKERELTLGGYNLSYFNKSDLFWNNIEGSDWALHLSKIAFDHSEFSRQGLSLKLALEISGIILPKTIYAAIFLKFKNSHSECRIGDENMLYCVWSNEEVIESFPRFVLTFNETQQIVIHPRSYITKLTPILYRVNVREGDSENVIRIGGDFLDRVYVILHYRERRIGFVNYDVDLPSEEILEESPVLKSMLFSAGGISALTIIIAILYLCRKKPPKKLDPLGSVPESSLLICLLYTSPSPRDATLSRMPSSA